MTNSIDVHGLVLPLRTASLDEVPEQFRTCYTLEGDEFYLPAPVRVALQQEVAAGAERIAAKVREADEKLAALSTKHAETVEKLSARQKSAAAEESLLDAGCPLKKLAAATRELLCLADIVVAQDGTATVGGAPLGPFVAQWLQKRGLVAPPPVEPYFEKLLKGTLH